MYTWLWLPKQARSCFPAANCLPAQAQSCWWVACCYAVASSRSGEPLLMQVLSPPHNYAPQEANTNDGPLALYASYLFYCQKRSPQRQKGACAVWRTRGHCAAAGLTCGWYACGQRQLESPHPTARTSLTGKARSSSTINCSIGIVETDGIAWGLWPRRGGG